MANDRKQKLYDRLTAKGLKFNGIEGFDEKMKDRATAQKIYDRGVAHGLKFNDFDNWYSEFGPQKATSVTETVQPAATVTEPTNTTAAAPAVEAADQTQQPVVEEPAVAESAPQVEEHNADALTDDTPLQSWETPFDISKFLMNRMSNADVREKMSLQYDLEQKTYDTYHDPYGLKAQQQEQFNKANDLALSQTKQRVFLEGKEDVFDKAIDSVEAAFKETYSKSVKEKTDQPWYARLGMSPGVPGTGGLSGAVSHKDIAQLMNLAAPSTIAEAAMLTPEVNGLIDDYITSKYGKGDEKEKKGEDALAEMSEAEQELARKAINKESESIANMIKQGIVDRYHKNNMSSNALSYFGTNAFMNSLVGNIEKLILSQYGTGEFFAMMDKNAKDYNPSAGLSVATELGNFAVDLPIFNIVGAGSGLLVGLAERTVLGKTIEAGLSKAAQSTARWIISRTSKNAVSRLGTDAVTRFALENSAATTFQKAVMRGASFVPKIPATIANGILTMGTFNAGSGYIAAKASGQDYGWGDIMDAYSGAALFSLFTVPGHFMESVARSGVSKAIAFGSGLAVEGGYMSYEDAARQAELNGGNWEDVDYAKAITHGYLMAAGFKAMPSKYIDKDGNERVGVIEPLKARLGRGFKPKWAGELTWNNSFNEIAKRYGYKGEFAKFMETGEIDPSFAQFTNSEEGNAYQNGFYGEYERFMSDPNIPVEAKRSAAYVVEGKVTPMGKTIDADGNVVQVMSPEQSVVKFIPGEVNGKKVLRGVDPLGCILMERSFRNEEERSKFLSDWQGTVEANNLRYAENFAGALTEEEYEAIMAESNDLTEEVIRAKVSEAQIEKRDRLIAETKKKVGNGLEEALNKPYEKRSQEEQALVDTYMKELEHAGQTPEVRALDEATGEDGMVVFAEKNADGKEVYVVKYPENEKEVAIIDTETGEKEVVLATEITELGSESAEDVLASINETYDPAKGPKKGNVVWIRDYYNRWQEVEIDSVDEDGIAWFIDPVNGVKTGTDKAAIDQWQQRHDAEESKAMQDADNAANKQDELRQKQEAIKAQQQKDHDEAPFFVEVDGKMVPAAEYNEVGAGLAEVKLMDGTYLQDYVEISKVHPGDDVRASEKKEADAAAEKERKAAEEEAAKKAAEEKKATLKNIEDQLKTSVDENGVADVEAQVKKLVDDGILTPGEAKVFENQIKAKRQEITPKVDGEKPNLSADALKNLRDSDVFNILDKVVSDNETEYTAEELGNLFYRIEDINVVSDEVDYKSALLEEKLNKVVAKEFDSVLAVAFDPWEQYDGHRKFPKYIDKLNTLIDLGHKMTPEQQKQYNQLLEKAGLDTVSGFDVKSTDEDGEEYFIVDGIDNPDVEIVRNNLGGGFMASIKAGSETAKAALKAVADAKDWYDEGVMVFAGSKTAIRNKMRKAYAELEKMRNAKPEKPAEKTKKRGVNPFPNMPQGEKWTPKPDQYGIKEGDVFYDKKGNKITLSRYGDSGVGFGGIYNVFDKDGRVLSNGGVKADEIQKKLKNGTWKKANGDEPSPINKAIETFKSATDKLYKAFQKGPDAPKEVAERDKAEKELAKQMESLSDEDLLKMATATGEAKYDRPLEILVGEELKRRYWNETGFTDKNRATYDRKQLVLGNEAQKMWLYGDHIHGHGKDVADEWLRAYNELSSKPFATEKEWDDHVADVRKTEEKTPRRSKDKPNPKYPKAEGEWLAALDARAGWKNAYDGMVEMSRAKPKTDSYDELHKWMTDRYNEMKSKYGENDMRTRWAKGYLDHPGYIESELVEGKPKPESKKAEPKKAESKKTGSVSDEDRQKIMTMTREDYHAVKDGTPLNDKIAQVSEEYRNYIKPFAEAYKEAHESGDKARIDKAAADLLSAFEKSPLYLLEGTIEGEKKRIKISNSMEKRRFFKDGAGKWFETDSKGVGTKRFDELTPEEQAEARDRYTLNPMQLDRLKLMEDALKTVKKNLKAAAKAEAPVEEKKQNKTNGLVENEGSRKLEEATRNLLDSMGSQTGRNVEVKKLPEGVDGYYDPKTNTIYVAEDVVKVSDEAVRWTMGHETTHLLKDENPELWPRFESFVKTSMGVDKFNEKVEKLRKKYQEAINDPDITEEMREALRRYTDADYREEVLANWAGDHALVDKKFAEKLIKDAEEIGTDVPGLIKKFIASIERMITNIKKAIMGKPNADEIERLKSLENAKKIWSQMYDVAVAKHNAAVEQANNGETLGKKRMSLRDLERDGNPDDPEWLKRNGLELRDAYKLMRLTDDKKLQTLYIGRETYDIPNWYNADSPDLSMFDNLEQDYFYLFDDNNNVIDKKPIKYGKNYNIGGLTKKEILDANDNGFRWMTVARYADGSRKIGNMGINGGKDESPSWYAIRPGIHAGSEPSMQQIASGSKEEKAAMGGYRDDNLVWVKGKVLVGLNEEEMAELNAKGEIQSHIPSGGYIKGTSSFVTKGMDWFITNAFKPEKIISDREAMAEIDRANADPELTEKIPYDHPRRNGRLFNAETMELEEAAEKSADVTRMVEKEGVSEQNANKLEENGLVAEDGIVMSKEAQKLKEETGYKPLPPEGPKPKIRLSYGSKDEWKKNYLGDTPKKREEVIANVIDTWYNSAAADDLVHDYMNYRQYPAKGLNTDGKGPLRKNQEYRFTFDLDTTCPRTFQYLNYASEIEKYLGRPLSQREAELLIEKMRASGQMIPCTYCYAENKRQALKQYFLDFMDARKGVIGNKSEEDAFAAMYGHTKDGLTEAAQKVYERWRGQDDELNKYNPTIDKLVHDHNMARSVVMGLLDTYGESAASNSTVSLVERLCKELGVDYSNEASHIDKGIRAQFKDIVNEWRYDMFEGHGHKDVTKLDEDDLSFGIIDKYSMALWDEMTKYGKSASSAKNAVRYHPYTDELQRLSEEDKAFVNGMGGLRMHSTNDFRIDYVGDYFQLMADMSKHGFMGHTYTKSPEFVEIFGNTGYRINMSIAAYDVVDKDGNIHVVMNPDEGFHWETAKSLRSKSKNAGAMFMTTSEAQLQYALDSDWVDMIIPFHSSGLPKEIWYDMRRWEDAQKNQNESYLNSEEMRERLVQKGVEIPEGADVEKLYFKTFNIKPKKYDSKGKLITPHFLPGGGNGWPAHGNDAKKYFDLCEQYGVRPRFYGTKVKDANGNQIDVTEHPGYFKLIKETARTDYKQTPVQFNLDKPDPNLAIPEYTLINKDNLASMDKAMVDKLIKMQGAFIDPKTGMLYIPNKNAGTNKTPLDYAMYKLREFAGRNGYEGYKEDQFRVVDRFIEDVVNYEKRTGKQRPVDYLSELDRMNWAIIRGSVLDIYGEKVDMTNIPYHPQLESAESTVLKRREGESYKDYAQRVLDEYDKARAKVEMPVKNTFRPLKLRDGESWMQFAERVLEEWERSKKENQNPDDDPTTPNGGGKGRMRLSYGNSKERDKEYADAVKSGDEETARRMVKDAAKAAMPDTKVVDENGDPLVVYHGTSDAGFTEFWGDITYFTDDKYATQDYIDGNYDGSENPNKGKLPKDATFRNFGTIEEWNKVDDMDMSKEKERLMDEYISKANAYLSKFSGDRLERDGFTTWLIRNDGKRFYNPGLSKAMQHVGITTQGAKYPVYLEMNNPFVIDAKGESWDNLPITVNGVSLPEIFVYGNSKTTSTDTWAEFLKYEGKELGFDGLIVKNVFDSKTSEGTITDYITFEPNQIKSADPVTYDNDGNVIPLSERFNKNKKDIRFSLGSAPRSAEMDAREADLDFKAEEKFNDVKTAYTDMMARQAGRLDTPEGIKDAARDITEFIQANINSFVADELGSMRIKSLITQIRRATTRQELEAPVKKAEQILNDAEIIATQKRLDKTMDAVLQKKNDRGVLVENRVHNTMREVFEGVRKTYDNPSLTSTASDMLIKKTSKEASALRGRIAALKAGTPKPEDAGHVGDAAWMANLDAKLKAKESEVRQNVQDRVDALNKAIEKELNDIDALRTKTDDDIADKISAGEAPGEDLVFQKVVTIPLKEAAVEVRNAYTDMESIKAQWQEELAILNGIRRAPGYKARKTAQAAKVAALEEAYMQAQEKVIKAAGMFNENMKYILSMGHEMLKDKMKAEVEHKKMIINSALGDVKHSKVRLEGERTGVARGIRNGLQKLDDYATIPLWSADFALQMADQNHRNGEGFLYKYYMKDPDHGLVAANDNMYKGRKAFGDALNSKVTEIFGIKESLLTGRSSFAELRQRAQEDLGVPIERTLTTDEAKKLTHNTGGRVIDQTEADLLNAIGYGDRDDWQAGDMRPWEKGDPYTVEHMTKAHALYLWLTWRQADGKMKMANMGYTDEAIDAIEKALGPEYIKLGEWMTEEFLPQLWQEKYLPRYKELYGTTIPITKKYFPLKIDKDSIRQTGGIDQMSKQFMVSTVTPALIQRTRNTAKIDPDADAFDVIQQYGNLMEQWHAMAPIIKDINTLHQSFAVKECMNANHEGSFNTLMKAFQVATGSLYDTDQSKNMRMLNEAIGKTISTGARAAIGFRVNTALKQMLSYPAFYAYRGDAQFYAELTANNPLLGIGLATAMFRGNKRTIGWRGTHEWALEHLPAYRQRVGEGDMGLEGMNDETWSDDAFIRQLSKMGMKANRFVDTMTIAAGARAVYNCAMRKAKKMGMSREEAERFAVIEAEIAYNQSQQSSRPEFSSEAQKNGGSLVRSLLMFRNASISYTRQVRLSAHDMSKALRMCQQNGASETAKIMGAAAWTMATFGALLPMYWYMGGHTNQMYQALSGNGMDDDDEKGLWNSIATGMLTDGTTFGAPIAAWVNKYGFKITPALDDFYDTFINDRKTLTAQTAMQYALQYGIGLNLETMDNIMAGLDEIYASATDAPDANLLIGVLLLINNPKSDRRGWARQMYAQYGPVEYAKAWNMASQVQQSEKRANDRVEETIERRDEDFYKAMQQIKDLEKTFNKATKEEQKAILESDEYKALQPIFDKGIWDTYSALIVPAMRANARKLNAEGVNFKKGGHGTLMQGASDETLMKELDKLIKQWKDLQNK